MGSDADPTTPEPIGPRPLMGSPEQETSFTAAAGGGALALALARGLRTTGWTRTVSILFIAVFVVGLVGLVISSLL